MNCAVCLGAINRESRHAGYHDACLRRLLGAATVSPVLGFDRGEFLTDLARRFTRRMSISGVQQKLSMRRDGNQLAVTDIGGEFILKPSPEEFPHAAANEHACMLAGQLLGIATPPCGLVHFSDGEPAYLIRRYDRTPQGKVSQEDMAQLLGRARDASGEFRYRGSYEEVGNEIRAATGGKLSCVYDFFRRLVHRFLVGDGDYHLKNISVWRIGRDGDYAELTPNYDAVSTRLYLPSETVLALDLLVGGEFTATYEQLGYYTRADFEELGGRLGLTERATARVYADADRGVPQMLALLERSYLPSEMTLALAATVRERARCLGLEPGQL